MNIIIIENHETIRERLLRHLQSEGGFSQIETFSSIQHAIVGAHWNNTAILLIDIDPDNRSDQNLIKWIRKNHPHIDSMIYTLRDNGEITYTTNQPSTHYFCSSDTYPQKFIADLFAAINNDTDPSIASKAINRILNSNSSENPAFQLLEKMDQQMLQMIEKGYTYPKIAERFGISAQDVFKHIQNICKQMQHVGSRVAC